MSYVFSCDGEESKNHHGKAEGCAELLLQGKRRIFICTSPAETNQLVFSHRNEIEDHPSDAQDRHEQIETIASGLPITDEAQGDTFHNRFDEKEKDEHGRDERGDLRDWFVGFPRFVEQGTVEQNEHSGGFFEQTILRDIEDVGTKFAVLRSRRRS